MEHSSGNCMNIPLLNTDTDTLQALAFHRELVEARRLVKHSDLSFAAALEQVLQAAAGAPGLDQLLQARCQQLNALAELKAKKRQVARQKHQAKQAKSAIPSAIWCAWFDASARPNPGPCAIGAVLRAPDGREWQLSRSIGYADSSSAEYQALIAVLELTLTQGARDIVIYGDSRVVIDDLDPVTQNHAQGLADLRQQANELLQQIQGASLQWIPRARNQLADSLAQRGFEENGAIVYVSVDVDEVRAF
jgi:ribonuclease HI